MHLEIATISLEDGAAAGLVDAMRNGGGCDALNSAPGCQSAKVMQGVEHPENVLFLVEWDSVDAHNAARESEGFKKFQEIAGPYFARSSGGSMQHFDAS